MSKQTKRLHRRRHRQTHRRKPTTHRRRHRNTHRHRRSKHPEFMTHSRNRGQGQGQGQRVILFAIPEEKKSFKIIVDNNHKQFGNIIPGLREM